MTQQGFFCLISVLLQKHICWATPVRTRPSLEQPLKHSRSPQLAPADPRTTTYLILSSAESFQLESGRKSSPERRVGAQLTSYHYPAIPATYRELTDYLSKYESLIKPEGCSLLYRQIAEQNYGRPEQFVLCGQPSLLRPRPHHRVFLRPSVRLPAGLNLVYPLQSVV